MLICEVCGKCVSTIKNSQLSGSSLMLLQRLDKTGKNNGEIIVAVDTIGCSVGEVVLVTTGSAARNSIGNSSSTTDMAIVGIVDTYNCNS